MPPISYGNQIDRYIAKLTARTPLSTEDIAAVRSTIATFREVPAGRTFLEAGTTPRFVAVLLEGFAGPFRDLRSGARAIIDLAVSGDLLGCTSPLSGRLDLSVQALSPCMLALIESAAFERLLAGSPRFAEAHRTALDLEAAILRERVVTLGRRNAYQRLATVFCELYERLRLVGLTRDMSYDFPVSQADLGNYCGITPVHVNRTLRGLRESRLLTFRANRIEIHDYTQLRKLAEFDDSYLHLGRARA